MAGDASKLDASNSRQVRLIMVTPVFRRDERALLTELMALGHKNLILRKILSSPPGFADFSGG
ncbi:MAG: hypothetical protein ABIP07_05270 [Sphingomicrobium sp.]